MLHRLTVQAREAVARAEREATELGHDSIGTEHLLLGLAVEENGVAGRALASLGVTREELVSKAGSEIGRPARRPRLDPAALETIGIDLDEVRRRVEETFGEGALERTRARGRAACSDPHFLPRTKQALDLAWKEARTVRRPYADTEHLLLGLLRVKEGMAVQLLERLGVSSDDVRAAVGHELTSY